MVSSQLCPATLSACPISSDAISRDVNMLITHGFECVDFRTDLESCGGCAVVDASHDCTSIDGVKSVSCVSGRCQVNACQRGFIPSADGELCLPVL
ncbi:hypothetical protein DENSPDRAFT_770283 [Dentipellis sp. KUC8613]|nr:hypothetical protein DENSPDRAFT_770283 [Dentipellis sp. KUC8613]